MSEKKFDAFALPGSELWSAGSLAELNGECDDGLKVGMKIERGVSLPPSMSDLCSADDVITTMQDRSYEFAGEAGDLFSVTKEAEIELDLVLKAWFEKHTNLTFYKVIETEDYVVTQADIDSLQAEDQA